jgi:polysaccharide deacetylase 2 family uncharacterized protein YibQ
MSGRSRKVPRRRSRRTISARPSIRMFLLALALPAVVVLSWLAYRFVVASLPAETPRATIVERPDEPGPLPPPAIVETPRIERVLLDAGVERDRLRWENGHLLVETFESVDAIAEVVRNAIPGCVVSRDGEILTVSHGEEGADRLRVVQLHRGTEFDGFTPTSERDAPPDSRAPKGARKIVLILDDVGFENQPLERAASIDARISFAVIPGSPRAQESAEYLASKGFEILCHLPMEPLDYPNVSPGTRAIFTSMTDEDIRALTAANIAAIPHVKGVNNHMGSRATRDRRVMRNVAEVLVQSGVYFVDSRTAGSSVAAQVTRDARVPTGSRDVFLDDDPSEEAVRRQVRLLARLSERRDYVIGIGHVYPTTVRVLRDEIPRLSAEGYEFLFASEVLR